MAETPKLPKVPKPKAPSTPKAPKAPSPKSSAPRQANSSSPQKPLGIQQPSKDQLLREEEGLAQQASARQQQSKAASGKKTSKIARQARNMSGNAIKNLDEIAKSGPSEPNENVAKKAAKQVGKDAAKVASGAIKGALRGGLAGAGTGAAKALLKSRTFWTVGTAIFLAGFMFYGGIAGVLLFGLMGDTDSGHESSSRRTAGEEVAETVGDAYGGGGTTERMLQHVANTSGADFYILSSALQEENPSVDGQERPDDGWFGLTDEAVDELVEDIPRAEEPEDLDIEDEARWLASYISNQQHELFGNGVSPDLSTGYSLAVTPGGRTPLDGAEDRREATFDTWIEAVEALPIQDADDKAHSIVDRARNWKLGTQALLCGSPSQIVSDTSDDEDSDDADDSTQAVSTGGASGAPAEYQGYIANAAQVSGLSEEILTAQIKQESNFNPNAVSPAGAMGLTQFMPGTWAQYGNGRDPFDPEAAIDAQGRYMKVLMDIVKPLANGDENEQVRLALAAYNAGPGNVQKFGGIPPFRETQNYVEIITGAVGDDLFSVGCSAFASGLKVEGVGTDDYPYRLPLGASGWGQRSVFGSTPRQCTDFTLWRVNQAMGWTPGSGTPPPFTFKALGVSYAGFGNGAGSWVDILTQVDGIEFTNDPQPGDIAWWDYHDIGGGFGHVGFVAEVNGDTVTVEHYNYSSPNRYSATTHSSGSIPGYIRIGQLNNSNVDA